MRTRPARLKYVAGFNIDTVAAAAGEDPNTLRLENLDTDLLPPPLAIEATRAAVGLDSANSYLPFTGQLAAKEAVAAHVASRSGVKYDPETEIILTASDGDCLLDALLALTDPGDEIVLTDPTYAGMLNRVYLAGGVPRLVAMTAGDGTWRLDIDALEAAVTPGTRAVFLQNPSFPAGYRLNDEEWQAITRLCVEKDLWLIYWSFMEGVVYDGLPVVSPVSYPGMRDRTVIVGTPSIEQRMIGWRIGWIVAPAAVIPDLAMVHIYNGITPGGIAQAGLIAALGGADDGLAQCIEEWQRRRDALTASLEGFAMIPAAGGWSQILDTTEHGVNPSDLSRVLLGHGVAATAMTGWGGDVAGRHLRLVFSNEPVERIELLGDRFRAAVRGAGGRIP
ncbi:aminotransferase [Arthrobacter sp. StoSoilA2]|uniref:pyridoxal phosphate-dependent aminotransferase n=1 Tax=unclassified Arthrobacter TaxID=235627 RepID=UPI001CC62C5C|nr:MULTISPECIES: pyridoxal phosphate-dependent aminotransferase [unclassified Arthrobacter]BCW34379.1 aminotransferase [Arthrobacter sp. StoSoilA2]BCW52121.1 aminotransferase [Arthrobacter sp. StoSoilB13]